MTLLGWALAIAGWALVVWQQLRIWREAELAEHWRKSYLRAWQQRCEMSDDLMAVLGVRPVAPQPRLRLVRGE